MRTGGFAWGTNLDAKNATDNNGHAVTFIGRGLATRTDSYPTGESPPDLGSSEFVLKGRRFNAHALATSLDVHSDVQLTCESDEGSCTVSGVLLVQQMKSPTSSEVCTTSQAKQTKTIATASHHEKLHLKALDVGFNPTCAARSFIIKTQVTLISEDSACVPGIDVVTGGPRDACDYVVVESGNHDDPALTYSGGRSITVVVQDFPVVSQ